MSQSAQTNGIAKRFMLNDKDAANKGFYYASCSETGRDGPDQVLPGDNITTTKADGHVRIELNEKYPNSAPPISIPGLLSKIAKQFPDHVALVSRPDAENKSKTYTYKQYENQVRTVAKAFLKLGLERYHGVCILGFNSPEWFFADLGAIYAGGLAVGIYTTNSPEACQHCAISSNANIIVVDDEKQLKKILQIKHNLPNLKAIVQYEGVPEQKDVLSWNDLIQIGEKESEDKLDELLKTVAANECCTLVYTSGTVGNPKAVMLSHDNFLYTVEATNNVLKLQPATETLISYLPLSHVAGQLIDIFYCIKQAVTVYFADKDAFKGSLINTMIKVRPTSFIGVPRVWEKIHEKMQVAAHNSGFVKKWIISWAKSQALYYNMNKMNGNDHKHWGYIFAKWLIFNKVRALLGLDRCTRCFTAAAPLSTEIKQYFMSLDILLLDIYGMSECSGPHTCSTPDNFRLGSIGQTISGFYSKLANPDSNGEGEICMRGRHVFMGYLNEPEKTAEALDADGWLHSGDLGKIDSNNFLYATGRIKELIITAGGENIPPVHIEHLVLTELSALSNVLLVGDKRKYLTILVTLKTEVNINTGEPKDNFTMDTLKWLQSIGSTSKTVSDVLKTHDSLVYEEIDKAIKRVNDKVMSNAQKIQKFRILPHDFSLFTGELGPTLKMKRNVIYKMYENLIEDMYK